MDTEKRLALCFALSMLVILVFSWQNTKKMPQRRTAQQKPTAIQESPRTSTTPTPIAGKPSLEESIPSRPENNNAWTWLPESPLETDTGTVVVESKLYRITFSKTGAIPRSWQLTKYNELFADPRYLRMLAKNNPADEYDLANQSPDRQKAHLELKHYEELQNAPHNPVDAVNPAYEFGEAGLIFKWGSRHSDKFIPYQCSTEKITDPTEVRFVYSNNGITLEKIYTFNPNSYLLGLRVRITNQSDSTISFAESSNDENGFYDINWYGGFGFPSLRRDAKNNTHLQLEGKNSLLPTEGLLKQLQKNQSLLRGEYSSPTLMETGKTVHWVGVSQKYFLAAIIPHSQTKMALQGVSSPGGKARNVLKPHVGIRTTVPSLENNSKSIEHQFTIYVGPLEDDKLLEAKAGLEEARRIFLRRFTGPITNLMLYLLQTFYRIVPNYGVAIILLTLLFKMLLFPLYNKQLQSMKKMQALQPHINALKEKYKDDQQKLQKEQMELFRKHKINPLAGCLPMLPTIPVFIALYATFGMALELRGAPFFGWITDLSAPDGAFYIPVGSYIFTVNILPLAYAVLMLWSMSRQKVEGPNATMMKIFPLIFVFFFWSIASGVLLYFVISIFMDQLQRIVMEKFQSSEPLPGKVKK